MQNVDIFVEYSFMELIQKYFYKQLKFESYNKIALSRIHNISIVLKYNLIT